MNQFMEAIMSVPARIGDLALAPGSFAESSPPALLVLHPPSQTAPDLPEDEQKFLTMHIGVVLAQS